VAAAFAAHSVVQIGKKHLHERGDAAKGDQK
jgi:hypothetical protein